MDCEDEVKSFRNLLPFNRRFPEQDNTLTDPPLGGINTSSSYRLLYP